MKSESYKDFFKDGRYGGAKVMVQLKDAGTFTAMVDARHELQLATLRRVDPNAAKMIMERLGRDLTEAEIAELPRQEAVVPPIPVLIGELEALGEDLLLLTYVGQDRRFRICFPAEDVKHVTVAENTRIVV
jgi:hypothetical protein